MNEITVARFHDILYKFFALLTCFGFLMLAFDLITLANRKPLYMFLQPLSGWENILGLAPVVFLIIGCWWVALKHRKQAKDAKWR